MSRLVLDASVAASWLLEDEFDPGTEAAIVQLSEEGAVVPPLWHYEVRNTLLVAERRGRLSGSDAVQLLDRLTWLPIETDREADLMVAFNLARDHGLSFYDAMYLELATRSDAPLATLDAKLARAAAAEGLEVSSP